MFFKKKKRMIDVRELQKRGIMKIPRHDINIETNKEGFVELGKNSNPVANSASVIVEQAGQNASDIFKFVNSPPTPPNDLRKISQQVSDLDNKIYKLEQRIELLERKAGVMSGSENLSPIGW